MPSTFVDTLSGSGLMAGHVPDVSPPGVSWVEPSNLFALTGGKAIPNGTQSAKTVFDVGIPDVGAIWSVELDFGWGDVSTVNGRGIGLKFAYGTTGGIADFCEIFIRGTPSAGSVNSVAATPDASMHTVRAEIDFAAGKVYYKLDGALIRTDTPYLGFVDGSEPGFLSLNGDDNRAVQANRFYASRVEVNVGPPPPPGNFWTSLVGTSEAA